MRTWLRWTLGAVAATLLSSIALACGSDDDDSGGGATVAAATPRQGGEIVVQHRQFRSFDPHCTGSSRDVSQLGMVFRGLYRLDRNDSVQPELAAALPAVSADGRTYTVKLKPGLRWSDGAPLTARDVVAGLQRTCNPDVAGQYAGNLFNITGCKEYYTAGKKPAAEKEELLKGLGVRQLDELTAEIRLNAPQATFTTQLALWFAWPSPAHIVQHPGDPWPTDLTKLAFSGPFKVESHREKESLTMVRNENYGGRHLAYLDRVTLRFIDNLETANNAYRNNEVMLTRANVTSLDVLQADARLSRELARAGRSGNTHGLTINMAAAPLDNPLLRRALSQATDRETLNRVVHKGAHVPTTSWIPEPLLGILPDPFAKSTGFNADEAKKTFAASGAPAGLKLQLMIIDTPADRDTAAFLKEQWSKILGVDLQIDVLDSATIQQRYEQEQFQMTLVGWNQDFPDPENWVDGIFNIGGPNNHSNCANRQIDELLAKAKGNLDADERRTQYVEMNRLIAEELCGVAPFYHQRTYYLVSPKLKGATENSSPQDRYLAGDYAIEDWWLEG